MASKTSPNRFALLVGIDRYLNDGSRKNENGETLFLGELRGCVNDVQAVAELLRNEFHIEKPCILTSPPTTSSFTCPAEPKELPDRRPTFDNIKKEFDVVAEQGNAGDLFFFHFSGHGARLQRTSKSPPGRLEDPSLMTMDFCCGKPAVRGWQLNEWLKRLNEKKIRTIVILDSCHSGGAWRTDKTFRTPEGDWRTIPNLPTDEEAITETAVISVIRDGELENSWSINPDGFTLMAACKSDEVAAEMTVNGISYGAFTHGLLACLEQNRPSEAIVTYRNLRDQLIKRVSGQTPQVYGRDRLVFFGDEEPFSTTPIVVRLEGERIYLPIGKAHGIREKSEFTTYPPMSRATFSVDRIDDFECSAPVRSDYAQTLRQHLYQVIPRRWGLGDDILQVLVHPTLGSEFQQALHAALQERIVGNIEITESNDSYEPGSDVFRVTKHGNGGIDLTGPLTLIGYEGPVRGLDLTGVDPAQLATKSAVALAHLSRFRQILSLSNKAAQQLAPFELTLKPKNFGGNHTGGQEIDLTFRSTAASQLHFTALVLSPGFHVKQLYPPEDFPRSVNSGHEVSFAFSLTIPERLNGYGEQRDIIRIVVTKGKQLSWKNLELSDIWNADQLAHKLSGSPRDAILSSERSLWVKDNIILTKKQRGGKNVHWTSYLVD
ncbi:TPR domain-containing protein [Fusarium oxysporum f. sp. phaseoli]